MDSIRSTIQNGGRRGANRPFGPAPEPAATPAPAEFNPDDLQILDDPIPSKRCGPETRYAAKFKAMKVGQCLEVHQDHIPSVSGSMRKWLKDNKVEASVKSVKVYPGCPKQWGRVWMAPGAPKAKAKKPSKPLH